MKNSIDKITLKSIKNLKFKCIKCSNCCRIEPGAVMITEKDLKRISSFLKIEQKYFIKEYCRPVYKGLNKIISLKEKPGFDCIFWNEGCLIYKARPIQCQTYPYWTSIVKSEKNIKDESKRCKGINSNEDIDMEDKIRYYHMHKTIKHIKYPD